MRNRLTSLIAATWASVAQFSIFAELQPCSGDIEVCRSAGVYEFQPRTGLACGGSIEPGSGAGLLGAPVSAAMPGVGPAVGLDEAAAVAAGRTQTRMTPQQVHAVQNRMAALSKPVASSASASCSALPAGHRRRIFFGLPASNPNAFGVGYEEVDASGNPVPGTFEDISEFDPSHVNVCLPLGSGNTPVTEEWELVNVAGELHNFHMHQTKFYVRAENAPPGDGGALMDNVPLPTGGAACDGSVASWRSGDCKVQMVRVNIPFAEVGDYVYHCDIGEHQAGGMMAHIRVIARP